MRGRGDPHVIIVGGDALALSTARRDLSVAGPSGRRAVAGRPRIRRARSRRSARCSSPAGRRAATGSTRPGSRRRSRSWRCRATISSICRWRCGRATPIRASASCCASSTARSPPRSSRTWPTARSCRWPGIRPRPTPPRRSIPSCLRGLQFPERDGPLTGFADADRRSIAMSPGTPSPRPKQALGARIVAIDGDDRDRPRRHDRAGRAAGRLRRARPAAARRRRASRPQTAAARRGSPGCAASCTGCLGGCAGPTLYRRASRPPRLSCSRLGAWHFRASFDSDWLTAAYFVLTTMTTTGYGDIAPNHDDPVDVAMAMVLMLSGTIFTGIFIAFVASRLTRAQWVRMQGLRPIQPARPHHRLRLRQHRHRGHRPAARLRHAARRGRAEPRYRVGRARARSRLRSVDRRCQPRRHARSVQSRRGAQPGRADQCRHPEPRNRAGRARPQSQHADRAAHRRGELCRLDRPPFPVQTTFSVAALAAPVFAGLSRFAGSRGRVAVADQEFALGFYTIGEDLQPRPPEGAILLAVARDGEFRLAAS